MRQRHTVVQYGVYPLTHGLCTSSGTKLPAVGAGGVGTAGGGLYCRHISGFTQSIPTTPVIRTEWPVCRERRGRKEFSRRTDQQYLFSRRPSQYVSDQANSTLCATCQLRTTCRTGNHCTRRQVRRRRRSHPRPNQGNRCSPLCIAPPCRSAEGGAAHLDLDARCFVASSAADDDG